MRRQLLYVLALCASALLLMGQTTHYPARSVVFNDSNDSLQTLYTGGSLGGVTGPGVVINGNAVTWDGTSGDLIQDAGSPPVLGPASSVSGNLAIFNDSSGGVLKDAGLKPLQFYGDCTVDQLYGGSDGDDPALHSCPGIPSGRPPVGAVVNVPDAASEIFDRCGPNALYAYEVYGVDAGDATDQDPGNSPVLCVYTETQLAWDPYEGEDTPIGLWQEFLDPKFHGVLLTEARGTKYDKTLNVKFCQSDSPANDIGDQCYVAGVAAGQCGGTGTCAQATAGEVWAALNRNRAGLEEFHLLQAVGYNAYGAFPNDSPANNLASPPQRETWWGCINDTSCRGPALVDTNLRRLIQLNMNKETQGAGAYVTGGFLSPTQNRYAADGSFEQITGARYSQLNVDFNRGDTGGSAAGTIDDYPVGISTDLIQLYQTSPDGAGDEVTGRGWLFWASGDLFPGSGVGSNHGRVVYSVIPNANDSSFGKYATLLYPHSCAISNDEPGNVWSAAGIDVCAHGGWFNNRTASGDVDVLINTGAGAQNSPPGVTHFEVLVMSDSNAMRFRNWRTGSSDTFHINGPSGRVSCSPDQWLKSPATQGARAVVREPWVARFEVYPSGPGNDSWTCES